MLKPLLNGWQNPQSSAPSHVLDARLHELGKQLKIVAELCDQGDSDKLKDELKKLAELAKKIGPLLNWSETLWQRINRPVK